MSIELYIFLEDHKVPTLDSWQAELGRLGLPVAIAAPFNPRTDSGFRPATYHEKQTGFEFSVGTSAEILALYPHIVSAVGKRSTCAIFRWAGDFDEMSAALSAAVSLVKLTEGIYYYPSDDLLYQADEAVQITKTELGFR